MKRISSIFLILLFLGCDQNVIDPNSSVSSNDRLKSYNVKLRIRNLTNTKLESIVSNNQSYDDLESGETSDYEGFSRIFKVPSISLTINGVQYNLNSTPNFPTYEELGYFTIVVNNYNAVNTTLAAEKIKDQ